MGRLEAKQIIISGGSAGIGRAIARQCAAEGATVILVARAQNLLEEALEQARRISPKEHRAYSLDVGDWEAVRGFAEWVKREKLSPNGLVNCAGIFGPIGKTTEVDMREFAAAVQINFLGTVYMCHALAPLLNGAGRKKIVNCSGGGGTFAFPNYSAYATSKVAIVRFTENLALELAEDRVDVNCIAPGFVVTRLHEQTLAAGVERAGAFYQNTQKQMAAGGVPPEKSAELSVFLLAPESDGITGKYISAPWDPWREPAFQKRLKTDKDFAALRRVDDQFVFQKEASR